MSKKKMEDGWYGQLESTWQSPSPVAPSRWTDVPSTYDGTREPRAIEVAGTKPEGVGRGPAGASVMSRPVAAKWRKMAYEQPEYVLSRRGWGSSRTASGTLKAASMDPSPGDGRAGLPHRCPAGPDSSTGLVSGHLRLLVSFIFSVLAPGRSVGDTRLGHLIARGMAWLGLCVCAKWDFYAQPFSYCLLCRVPEYLDRTLSEPVLSRLYS